MNVRYRVELSQIERDELTAMLGGGKHAARKLKRAQILLAADAGSCDAEIVRTVRVSLSSVGRTKRRFVEGNLERALSEEPRPGAERKLTGKEEALLVATACAKPPAGRKRWTLTLLADAMVKLTDHDSLSGETVRRRLAENDLKPWRRDMWCIPQVDGEYVARMESSTPRRRILNGRWSASTRPPSSSSARSVSRSRPGPDSASATITSIAATAPSISSSPSIRIAAGATSR
jgi:transposase